MNQPIQPILTIVMPCLNEARTLGACIERARHYIESAGIEAEIIVADNGSTDGSIELARSLGARVVDVAKRGYGCALATGIAAARGEFVIMGDSDASYDFGQCGAILDRLRAGYDLVVGNRFEGGIEQGAMPVLHRYLGNPVLSLIGRVFFRCPVGDIYCGLRGFRRDSIQRLNLRMPGMEFAIEMIVKAALFGLRIDEVPVTLSPDGRDRRPHLRTWPDGWRSLRFLLLYAPNWLFIIPGFALMVLSFLIGARIYIGTWYWGGVGFDVQTLFYFALMGIVGYQMVLFGLASRVLALHRGLLPEDQFVSRFFGVFNLEKGILLGLALIIGGVLGTIWSFLQWRAVSFGAMELSNSFRSVIPAGIAIVAGFQTIFASFFVSTLSLEGTR